MERDTQIHHQNIDSAFTNNDTTLHQLTGLHSESVYTCRIKMHEIRTNEMRLTHCKVPVLPHCEPLYQWHESWSCALSPSLPLLHNKKKLTDYHTVCNQ